jgi:uncharacterized membrane protein
MKVKLNIKERERTPVDIKHDERLLKRIQTLTDVVYALIIVQLFRIFPKPVVEDIGRESLAELFKNQGPAFATVIVGLIWVIIYWGQSNTLFGYLKRTNKKITSIAIVQMFLLLLYLYFIDLDNQTDGDVLALFAQSFCLAVAGYLSAFIWHYSAINGMLFEELGEAQKYSIYYKLFPEPIAAVITLPLAFLGAGWYSLGWLSVIPLGILFNNIAKRYQRKVQIA